MHLRFDAAPAVVSTPVPPDRPVEVFRSSHYLVSGRRTRSDGLPRLRVLSGWDDRICTPVGDDVVALRVS